MKVLENNASRPSSSAPTVIDAVVMMKESARRLANWHGLDAVIIADCVLLDVKMGVYSEA